MTIKEAFEFALNIKKHSLNNTPPTSILREGSIALKIV
jgi:hypothetical protein